MKAHLSYCLAVVFLAAGASACGSGTTTGESGQSGGTNSTSGGVVDNCVIDANARQIVAETIAEQVRAAEDVAKHVGNKQRGFAVQIPASKFGYVGYSALVTECPTDSVVQRCQSTSMDPPTGDFWTTHDACVRFYCQKGSSTIALVDTYMTMLPEKDVTKRHKFTYDTTNPAGAAIYDPNPLITWKIDLTDLTSVKVSADIDAAVKITPTEGALFDFKHKGTVSAAGADGAVSNVTLDLEFTGLFLAGDDPITGHAELDAAGSGSGAVKKGDVVIGNVLKDLNIEWVDECAPTP